MRFLSKVRTKLLDVIRRGAINEIDEIVSLVIKLVEEETAPKIASETNRLKLKVSTLKVSSVRQKNEIQRLDILITELYQELKDERSRKPGEIIHSSLSNGSPILSRPQQERSNTRVTKYLKNKRKSI